MASRVRSRKLVAFIVSHPIQYYAPLYQRLAQRSDLRIKVFFTWHAGNIPVEDRGFKTQVQWDIPLTGGYDFELVPNVSAAAGTHHFLGLRNPLLLERVMAWQPDVVHITGWAWYSHFLALRRLGKKDIPILFRGDSHLLDARQSGIYWWIKRAVLRRVFAYPTAFLVVGKANREYYQAFGVEQERMYACPHSIDVKRFAEPAEALELEAAQWRRQLGVSPESCVVLFAGKFERKKCPIELMHAVLALKDSNVVLVMVGGGELEGQVKAFASLHPQRVRVLPFQNQSRMPVVYRLGNLFVLPSAFGETWGLAVNEAISCGRAVLVSDRVGCAADVIDTTCGRIFSWENASNLAQALDEMTADRKKLSEMGQLAAQRAWLFDVPNTETTLVTAISQVCSRMTNSNAYKLFR